MKFSIDSKHIKNTNDLNILGKDIMAFPDDLSKFECDFKIGDFKFEISAKQNRVFITKERIVQEENYIGVYKIVYNYDQKHTKRSMEFAVVYFETSIKDTVLKKKVCAEEVVLYYMFQGVMCFKNKIIKGENLYDDYISKRQNFTPFETDKYREIIANKIQKGLINKEEIEITPEEIIQADFIKNRSVVHVVNNIMDLHIRITPPEKFGASEFYKGINKISLDNRKECFYVKEMEVKEFNNTVSDYKTDKLLGKTVTRIDVSDYCVTNSFYNKKILNKADYEVRVSPFKDEYPYKIEKIQLPLVVECFGFPTYLKIDNGEVKEECREVPFNIKKEFRPVYNKVKKDLDEDYRACFYFLCLGKNRKYSHSIMKFFTESNDFTLDEIDADIVELFYINGDRGEEVHRFYKKVKEFYETLKKLVEDNKSNLESSEFRLKLRKFVNNYKWS